MGISNDFGSLVVGMGTGFEKESTRAPQHDELEELIRDIICYAPWDEDNLYDRLMDRAVYREGYDQCTMRNYASYLSKLMQTAYGLPRDNSVSRLRSNRSVQYEIPKHTHSCPSLTDGSTLSEPSQAPRRVPAPIRMRPAMGAMKATVNHQATLPNTNAQYPLDDKNAQNGAVDYTSGGDEDSMGIDDAQGLEGNSSAQPHEENDFSPPNTGTPMSTSSEDEDEYEEEEGEEEDDGDDESEEDPIESLHDAIRQVFLLNTGVAERVIDHLNNLPPDRRAEVYGYEAVSSHSPGRPRSGGNSTSFSDKPKARKRKRIGTSPSGSAQDHVHESDDEENHVRVSRRSSKNQPGIRKFACGFHLLDASKYCTGSTLGITPTQYRTCAGPGFETINHYKRHLGRKHVLHQCSRCGSIFKKPGDLQVHLAQDQRCDVTPFEPRNDMSQNKWEDVQEAFENPNGVYDDKERWFRVWDKLFPGVPRPPEPYYGVPHRVALTRFCEIFNGILTDNPRISQDPDLRAYIDAALATAMEVVNQSAPPLESEVNGRSAPPMPEQAPTLNNGVLDVAFNTNQGNNPTVNTYSISNITVNTADHETTLLGPERSVPNTSFSSTQPILNNGVLNLASSVHQEDGMRTVTPEGSPTVRPIPPATADPAIGPAYHGNEADPNDEIIVDPLLQQLIDDYYTGGNEDQNAIL